MRGLLGSFGGIRYAGAPYSLRRTAVVGEERKSAKSGKRGPAPKIQQQLELIGTLPKGKQCVIAQLIDAMLQGNA